MAALVGSAFASSSTYLKQPLCSLAEKAATTYAKRFVSPPDTLLTCLHRLLQKITNGTLVIHTPGHTYHFGERPDEHHHFHHPKPKGPYAELRVRSPNFWLRLCAMGDLGFSEAYMYGEVDCDDLVQVFTVRTPSMTRSRERPYSSCVSDSGLTRAS